MATEAGRRVLGRDGETPDVRPPRLTRAERQAETRQRLLRAAATVFARRGFAGASLDDVAAQAGFTKGAVYSNFDSKDALFEAVLNERCTTAIDEVTRMLSPWGIEAPLNELGQVFGRRMLEDRDWTRLFVEFWSQAMRDPTVLRQLDAARRKTREAIARAIERSSLARNGRLLLSADQLAVAAMAVMDGFALQMLLDPDAVDIATFGSALSLLAGRRLEPSAQASRDASTHAERTNGKGLR